jgi:hypothetical protein
MPTLKIAGTLSFPISDEATLSSRSFSAELAYTERNVDDLVIVGAQADVDLMGRIADAKACYIEVVAGAGTLKVNAATQTLPITVDGGFWVWFNPDGGLTALTVTTSANATFRMYMFT